MNKKTFKFPSWVWPVGAIVIIGMWIFGQYNSLISLQVQMEKEWANVEVQYQRRADMVPQLVATVKGVANFESETLEAVTSARTKWMDTSADPNASLSDQMTATSGFDSALSRLLVTVEAYPTLTATENFQMLQVELAGTENRVAIAREDYNEVATSYNFGIKRIPVVLVAGILGFDEAPLFGAVEGAELAPEVNFETSE